VTSPAAFKNINHDALFVENESGDRRLVHPKDASWPDAVTFLDAHRDLLDAFRRGAAKPGFGLSVAFDWDYGAPTVMMTTV
jgi:hypothetical protein